MEEMIMLTTSKEMLQHAAANGYAVPAINTQGGNYDIIWAVCKAAEDLGSPIMLAHFNPHSRKGSDCKTNNFPFKYFPFFYTIY